MNQDFSNLNNSDANQSNNNILNNQALNNQSFSQNIGINSQQNDQQSMNTFENYNTNNQNLNNKPPKKMNFGLIIGIIVVVVVCIGVVLGSKLISNKNINNETLNNKTEESDKNANTNVNKSSDVQLVVYLNDLKITLGKTTMDEIIKNTDLEVIKDETNKHEGSTSNKPSLSSEDWIYYDKRIIQLSDGINVFVIESYFEKTNIVGEITTIRNGKTDDPAFDNSKGTTLSFEDAVIGKRINMGDMYTDFEHEVYNNSSVGSCNHSGYTISCYQSEHLSNDMFTYYLDDNQKVVNMTATLMSYYP